MNFCIDEDAKFSDVMDMYVVHHLKAMIDEETRMLSIGGVDDVKHTQDVIDACRVLLKYMVYGYH
jgi:hypothetical protein